MYKCSEALVVANRSFTRQARTLARANDVALWDRDTLVGKLLAVGDAGADTPVPTAQAEQAVVEALPTPAPSLQVEPGLMHCATCGASVSEKVRAYCLARPKRFGGRIYCFKHQRLAATAIDPR
jgi:restriction system protein